jgi:hypothetical protein
VRHGARFSLSAAAAAVGLSLLGVLPATSALADVQTVTLPITSFYQIVADPAHGHLYISQGSSTENDILVTNLSGREIGTITGQDGVMGLALSADGSTLYAALSTGDAVTAIDTTTLQQTASYPLAAGDAPAHLALQSGKVWVSYSTSTPADAAIGDIDLTATTPAFETQAATSGWYSPPVLAGDPSDTGILVAAVQGLSPSSIISYDVAADPATVDGQGTIFSCANAGDLAVLPGGADFLVTCGSGGTFAPYSTANPAQQETTAYNGQEPSAVAVDAAGDVAAGSTEIDVYQPGSFSTRNTFGLATGGIEPQGLAWAPDDSQVYAVTDTFSTGYTFYLSVVTSPLLPQTTLTLSGVTKASITKSVTLSGKLTMSAGGTLPAGTPVVVTRSVAGSTATKTFTEKTAASGSFSLTDTPPGAGHYTYTAAYAGSSTLAPSTAAHAVTVSLYTASISLSRGAGTYTYEPTVHVTAHLGTSYTNRRLSIYAQQYGSKTRKLLKTARVNSHGDVTVSYRAPHSATISASFSGDARYAARTVSTRVGIRARVAESVTGSYGRTSSAGHSYLLFHHNKKLRLTVRVSPDKHGQCVELQLEEYYNGTWYSAVGSCAYLTSASKAYGIVTLTGANRGYHYRVRVNYVRASTDTSNLSNAGAWQYFIVEA